MNVTTTNSGRMHAVEQSEVSKNRSVDVEDWQTEFHSDEERGNTRHVPTGNNTAV